MQVLIIAVFAVLLLAIPAAGELGETDDHDHYSLSDWFGDDGDK